MDRIKLSDHFTYKRILRFTLPSMAMMAFVSIYGAVDGFFVSNFVGTTAFAALNLIMPFIMVVSACGFMMGAGGNAIIGKTFGEGKPEQAKKYFSFFVWATLVMGIVFAILGVIFMEPIARLLGADNSTLRLCVIYGDISMVSLPLFMIQYLFQSFFIAAEKPEMGFKVTLIAGCTNMVLDAVFVGLLGWGLAGAAWATVTSEYVGGIIPLIYFARENDSTLRIVRTKFYGRAFVKACTNGSSELVSNIAMSFIAVVFNLQLLKYAGENGVAAYGVLMYVSFLFYAVFMGYCSGSAPIISYNYGSGNSDELKNVFKISIKLMSSGGIVMTVLGIITAAPVCAFFVGYDKVLLDMSVNGYRIYSFTYLLMGVGAFGSSMFTALNNGIISAIISGVRTFVFRLSAVLLLPLIFGINGIWLSTCVAEVFAFFLILYFFAANKRKYKYL